MSDLGSATGSIGLAGTGRTQNGASRAAHGPVPVNTHPPSGVRTPTDIMRQRRDREARKKAEQEARDREQEEAEHRRQESQERAQDPAQPYAAGVAGNRPSQRRAGPTAPAGADIQPESRTTQQPPGIPAAAQRPDSQAHGQAPMPHAHPRQPGPSAQHNPQQPLTGSTGVQKQPAQAPNQPGTSQAQQPPRRVGFPHAFERWETLSSHWEGLTGYWIRKLEQNSEALERDPISQQMARQVTDLSAAGANLFHAVVELQRLRASSERKFQRWFFDTRAEQERSKELQADLERQVRTEKQSRTEAMAALQKAESDKSRAESLLKEMRRELQISKEEARRAWEELGRREQEERDRTNSLRNGEPTLVGGVQVVPMIQGLPSRSNTANHPSGGQGKSSEGHYYEETPGSPTETDPFTEGQRPYQESDSQRYASRQPHTSAAAEPSGQYAGNYYEHDGEYTGRPASENDNRSYDPSAASSEPGDDEYGGYRRTQPQQGPSIVYPRPMSEESDDYERGSMEDEGGYVPSTMPPTTSAPYSQGSVDYSGSGWGTTWDSVTPRHRHPTRLSDVMEEEEPRTTPSRASRASRASQASRSVH